ncbi:uncharacterized protein IL334_006154 [Kwoniella shivajii]|uniref:Copper transport protein n=1 Tax=Kwoniella shivajii TaxID=564305 RepID=A0ABZ1D716_9TREE|nr:hypothetical protein IL334_006154 [Kwoniella shivajii]
MAGMDDMSSTGTGSMDMKMYFHGSIGTDMLWFASWMPTSAGATVGVCIGLFLFAIFERYLVAFRRACDASWRKGQIGYSRPTSNGTIPSSGNSSSLPLPSTLISRRSTNEKELYNHNASSHSGMDQLDATINEPISTYNGSSSGSAPSYSPDLTSKDKQKEQDEEMENFSHLPKAVRKGLDPGREGRWSRPFTWAVDLPRGLLQALQVLIHYLLMLVVMTFNIWWIISVVVGSGVGEMLFGRFGSTHSGH